MIRLKTPLDIEKLREGGKILADIHQKLAAMAVPGVSTADLDAKARELIQEAGAEPVLLGYKPPFTPRAYPAAICTSINEVLVHGIPNEDPRILKEGDVLKLDATIRYKGMVVDAAHTMGVGKISPEAQQLIDVTREARRIGIEQIRAGAYVGDIGAAIEEYVKPFKYGIVDALCGHGVGYEVHEEPQVPNFGRRGTGERLEAGMVLAIEPMLNAGKKQVDFDKKDGYTVRSRDKSLTAHFEHTVLVTETGYEILTEGVG